MPSSHNNPMGVGAEPVLPTLIHHKASRSTDALFGAQEHAHMRSPLPHVGMV